MEFMFNAIVIMMLIAFPVGLVLGTLDEYSTDISPGAVRNVRRSVQPTLVSIAAAHGRGVADLTRESSPPRRRRDAGSGTYPAAAGERLGAGAA